MELRQLRYFAEVARIGTYTGAAAALHVAQPALWQQVRSLERELRVPLFERAGRRVRITRHGQILLTRVERVIEQVDQTQRLARDLREGRDGIVVVACSHRHVPRFMAAVVGAFRRDHPGIAVELREHPPLPGLPVDDLSSGSADFALGTPQPDLFDGFRAYRANVVAAVHAGHPWAKRRELGIEQLRDKPLLLATKPNLSRVLLDQSFRAAGFEPRIEAESSSAATLVALGDQGLGIPVLGDDAMGTVRQSRGPIVVDQAGRLGAEVWLHWRHTSAMSPGLKGFIAVARALAQTTTRSPR